MGGRDGASRLRAFVDTNVLVRHLTGEPADQARRATAALSDAEELYLTDVVIAECVYVLSRVYRVPRERLVVVLRALLAMPTVVAADSGVLLRALEVYESGLHFAEAQLVAAAEASGVGRVLSFDRVDRALTHDDSSR